MVIEEANPPSEMRKVVEPLKRQSVQAAAAEVQSLNVPLVPSTQERSIIERIETEPAATTLERTEPEKELALVTDLVPESYVIPNPKVAPPTTPMPIPASATASQDILATSTTAKTLLLLTYGP